MPEPTPSLDDVLADRFAPLLTTASTEWFSTLKTLIQHIHREGVRDGITYAADNLTAITDNLNNTNATERDTLAELGAPPMIIAHILAYITDHIRLLAHQIPDPTEGNQ